jgi:histidine triad (HIT) family protein
MGDCIFCKIAKGEIPAKVVYRDDLVVAFHDIEPQAPVHVLIIPKEHIPTTLDVNEDNKELIGHIYQVASCIARELGVAETGFRIVNNCNVDAGQSVFHLHFHLLGGRKLGWPPG